MENSNQNQPQSSQQMQIKIDDSNIGGSYSNLINISYTPEEFILDFYSALPGIPSKLINRIIISPQHAQRLEGVLQNVIAKHANNEFGSQANLEEATGHAKIGFKTE